MDKTPYMLSSFFFCTIAEVNWKTEEYKLSFLSKQERPLWIKIGQELSILPNAFRNLANNVIRADLRLCNLRCMKVKKSVIIVKLFPEVF